MLFRSDDAGRTFSALPVTIAHSDESAWIAAVDPRNADVVYVRLNGASSDRLVATPDGGNTWVEVFVSIDRLLGTALSPEGDKLAYGGPKDGLYVGPSLPVGDAGSAPAPAAQVNTLNVRCLTWTKDALFACSVEAIAGFTVGLSTDQGKTFIPIHHMNTVCPIACAGDTSASACVTQWATLRERVGQTGDPCGLGESLDSGADAPFDGSSVASGAGGGCGCRMTQKAPGSAWIWGALLLAIVARFNDAPFEWLPARAGRYSPRRPSGPSSCAGRRRYCTADHRPETARRGAPPRRRPGPR